jgi:hypothetical protein
MLPYERISPPMSWGNLVFLVVVEKEHFFNFLPCSNSKMFVDVNVVVDVNVNVVDVNVVADVVVVKALLLFH